MSMHIALLRAVNVGGTGKIKMADLRDMAQAMGFTQVSTVLQSGNLVFDALSAKDLEDRLEAELDKRFGLKSAVIVRSGAAWAKIVAANPFLDEAKDDPSHTLAMPLKTEPSADGESALRAAIKGRETVTVVGQTAYFVYPDGIGESKLTAAIIERHLGAKGTARNWNTVLKLAGLTE
jgi:uncharacterized protein (DUF1697 family)